MRLSEDITIINCDNTDIKDNINQNETKDDTIIDFPSNASFEKLTKYIIINVSSNGKTRNLIQLYFHLSVLQNLFFKLRTKMKLY